MFIIITSNTNKIDFPDRLIYPINCQDDLDSAAALILQYTNAGVSVDFKFSETIEDEECGAE